MSLIQAMNKISIPYQTSRRLKIDYWWAGLGYYCLSLGIIILYAVGIFNSGTYLKREVVQGTVNPYVQEYTHPLIACKESGTCAAVRSELLGAGYCTDPTMNYHYDPTFKYTGAGGAGGPECQQVSVYEVTTKDENLVTFSTAYTEWQKYAWPCAAENDAGHAHNALATEALARCDPGTREEETPGQCMCTLEKAVFPLAIEDYTVKMPHGYYVPDLAGVSWKGESRLAAADIPRPGYPAALTTTIRVPDGKGGHVDSVQAPGTSISLTLKQILDMVDLNLTATNVGASDDYRADADPSYAGRLPTYRHTGVVVKVDVEYTNRQGSEFITWDQEVDAVVTVGLGTATWTSIGPKTFYSTYPVGAVGDQAYHRIIRYPQDVSVQFSTRGYVYAFDVMVLINALISLAVLMGIAGTIMDVIVFYALPHGTSTVLRNKRAEKVTRRATFRQLGMQAALYVKQFQALDTDNSHSLSLAELAKIFGLLPNVNQTQALQIAKTILTGRDGKVDENGLDFAEFMTIMNGDAIDFGAYLKEIGHAAGNLKRMGSSMATAAAAYSEVEAKGVELDDEAAEPSEAEMQRDVVRALCSHCRKPFGCPVGAKKISCPRCGTVNVAPRVDNPGGTKKKAPVMRVAKAAANVDEPSVTADQV